MNGPAAARRRGPVCGITGGSGSGPASWVESAGPGALVAIRVSTRRRVLVSWRARVLVSWRAHRRAGKLARPGERAERGLSL